MPKQITTTAYTLEELKGAHPDAYAKVAERWRNRVYGDQVPWCEETMISLKAVIEVCGGTLKNWSIGTDRGDVTVSVYDKYESGDCGVSRPKDAQWMLENVLRPNGYVKKNVLRPNGYVKKKGRADFPGHCKFTGYCADDDFLESVYKDLKSGMSLTDSLNALGSVASRMMADDMEQQANEESMEANWDGRLFDEDGEEVNEHKK